MRDDEEAEKTLLEPPDLQALLSDASRSHRQQFNRLMHEHATKRSEISRSERAYFERLYPATDLLVPDPRALAGIDAVVGLIAQVLQYTLREHVTTFALLEQDDSNPARPTGVGKSAIGFDLVGIDIPHSTIPRPDSRDDEASAIRAVGLLDKQTPKWLTAKHTSVQIISSDMPFLGSADGRLAVAPIVGEPVVATWDMARMISRKFDCHYYGPGGEKIPWLRAYTEMLATRYLLGVGGMFCDSKRLYPLDHVFILHKLLGTAGESRVAFRDYPAEMARIALLEQLTRNPAYRAEATVFWRIDEHEHLRRALEMLTRAGTLPRVCEVAITTNPDAEDAYWYLHEVREGIADRVGLSYAGAI
jgi:hypothetical protein